MSGTLKFSDLEALPRHSMVTLLQCGAPQPTCIVKWTGVSFSDFADPVTNTTTAKKKIKRQNYQIPKN